jgi:tetratricopeptide (TPR) repeat protein
MKIWKNHFLLICVTSAFILATNCIAQSGATRPRRVNSTTASVQPSPESDSISSTENTSSTSSISTARAYALLQQRQFAEAAREARRITEGQPNNAEAWKITGFAEMGLAQYEAAATSLTRALELQRAGGREDTNTSDALAQSLIQIENYERALPLLVAATTRAGARPDAQMFYMRGLAEYRTGRGQDAENSFGEVLRVNPRHAATHFLLGRIRFESDRTDAAIVALNRATAADPQLVEAWSLLAFAYLRRAASVEGARAEADYLNAVRAAERLYRLRTDTRSALVYGQALINARQFARAVTVLTQASQGDSPESATALYLLGVAHSRARAYPRAITALEAAARRSPNDANVQRELGYAYEVTRQFARALAAYERGAEIAPDDSGFREAVERVRPFATQRETRR